MSSEHNQRTTFIWTTHRLLIVCLLAAASWLALTVPATAQDVCLPQSVPNMWFITKVAGKNSYGYAKSETPAKLRGPLYFAFKGKINNGRLYLEGNIREHPAPSTRNAFRLLQLSANVNYVENNKIAISYCVAPTYRKLVIQGVEGIERFEGTAARYDGSARLELTFSELRDVPDKFRILIRSLKLVNSKSPNPKSISGEIFNAKVSVSTDLFYEMLR